MREALTMGCPHSRNVGSTLGCGHDGDCSAADAAEVAAANIEFGCYGLVVNEKASGQLAFSAEQCRLIRETWVKMSPQLTAIGKQVEFFDHLVATLRSLE